MGKQIEIAGGVWDSHDELIRCPKCKCDVIATVVHTVPFWMYVHTCQVCAAIITESEWENLGRFIDHGQVIETRVYQFDAPDQTPPLQPGQRIVVNGMLLEITGIEKRVERQTLKQTVFAVPTTVKIKPPKRRKNGHNPK